MRKTATLEVTYTINADANDEVTFTIEIVPQKLVSSSVMLDGDIKQIGFINDFSLGKVSGLRGKVLDTRTVVTDVSGDEPEVTVKYVFKINGTEDSVFQKKATIDEHQNPINFLARITLQ